ncbi:MAG: ATP-dependent DNA helicase [Deltaproteobacteria bacterium]|nr:ATP-dependent DNA helicase [Deltaproteobacteria bacterium]
MEILAEPNTSPERHFSVSVRFLVETFVRGQDLSGTFAASDRAVAGTRAHQRIQDMRPASYQREVAIAHTAEVRGRTIEISGRIDGILHQENGDVLEEIKSTARDLAVHQERQNPRHWAQLKVYAYMHAVRHNLSRVATCLTYVRLGSDAVIEIRRDFEFDELASFFDALLSLFLDRVDADSAWRSLRGQSIQALDFPFAAYRRGQRRMAVEIFRAVREKRQLLVQAPTGIGKTMAAVFPAIKALGEGLVDRIFFLAARTTGKQVAEETVAVLHGRGLRFRCLTLTAKEKICFNPGAACNGEECEFARGYYDRIDDALAYALGNDLLNRHLVETVARQHRVCPFEFSLDLALHADGIVCDYNYAFDPQSYLRRFFQTVEEAYLFLVDEAHNLVERSRDMFSARIERRLFEDTARETAGALPQLEALIGAVVEWMDAFRAAHAELDFLSTREAPEDLLAVLRRLVRESDAWLSLDRKALFRDALLELHFSVSRFLKVSEMFDERYAACYDMSGRNFLLNFFCIDPSLYLQRTLAAISATIFFSATLTPTDYFKEIFGGGEKTGELILPSPFPKKNFSLSVAGGISTVFAQRDVTRRKVAGTISAFVNAKRGNYLVFFPSYDYLVKVTAEFIPANPEIRVLCQAPGMSEHEREDFLRQFSFENRETCVGFAVLGGAFGEGIDLVGDRLAGAVVVSVGMPPPTPERELIREYFDMHRQAGWEFAYVFPGFNRVLQAAGRVIRTEVDKGAVLLIDKRYASRRYRSMFPFEWRPSYITGRKDLARVLGAFWDEP